MRIVCESFQKCVDLVCSRKRHAMREEAKNLLAWEAIADEAGNLNLDESPRRQLNEVLPKPNVIFPKVFSALIKI